MMSPRSQAQESTMNFPSGNAFWQAPAQFSQLPEDDFLALIQKQFSDVHGERRASQTTSEDSNPSTTASRRHSGQNDSEDQQLKRKASSDDLDPGPSSHAAKPSISSKRRQSTNPHHDESRLLKRKEQNRAAQRAFRERKEKHVKDLEDKVAALEAKNEAAQTENSNLRELLSRLQQENLELKQAQFSFSVPKPAPMPAPAPSSTVQSLSSPFGFFDNHSTFPPTPAPSQTPSEHPRYGTDIDWSSLTTFDPSMLSVLDEPPDVPIQTDSTPSPFGQYALPQSYKTIANNPLLMSFVDDSPFSSSNTTSPPNSFDHFNFNFSAPNSWAPTASSSGGNGHLLHSNHGLEELFGGNYAGNQTSPAFNAPVDSTSMSPVMHSTGDKAPQRSPPANSVNSSPSTSASQSPFSRAVPSRLADSPPSGSESTSSSVKLPPCVSRSEIAKHIAEDGPSPFTDPISSLRKTSDISAGDIVSCQGSNFPRIEERPENIEVLKAWRCITQNPHFKDADINELCAEFSKKARCDGTKVVLEPESVHQLFEQFKDLQEQLSIQQPRPDPPSSVGICSA